MAYHRKGEITNVVIESSSRIGGSTLEQAKYDIAWDSILGSGRYKMSWKYIELESLDPPSAPTNVIATVLSSTSASIAFTPSFGATSYTITSSPAGFTGSGASSPIVATGLSSNTIYTFTATATNLSGISTSSTASTAVTTSPDAPTNLRSTVLSSTSTSVVFTPTTTGNGTITSYTITSSPSGITGSGASSPITVSGLSPNTIYTFTSTATNSGGISTSSTASVAITTIPSPPTNVIATVINSTSASISFTAPTGGNGTITSYTVTSSPSTITATGATSPITVSGLTTNTAYTFTVIATNSGGSSAYNFRVSSNTATVPTTTTGTPYTITNFGSVAMINDATRGFVFNLTGSNCLSVVVTTPLNSTKSFWISTSTTTGSSNVFGTVKMPIWFNNTTFLRATVNFPPGVDVISNVAQTSTWLFYTITTSATTTTMYVNGTQVATASVAWTGDTATMYFGAYNQGNFLTGRMDDIRFYSSILTATEISTLYTTNSGTTSASSTASNSITTP